MSYQTFGTVMFCVLFFNFAGATDLYDSYDGKMSGSVYQFSANSVGGYELSCREDKTEIITPTKQSISLTEFDCKDLQGLLLIADKNNVVRLEVNEGKLISKEPLFDVDAQRIKSKNRKIK